MEHYTAFLLAVAQSAGCVRLEGILSVDDTVLDKPDSQEGKTELVSYFWSGLHGKAVKGINLVTLFDGEVGGMRVPVNFRVVDKTEGKTKNDLLP